MTSVIKNGSGVLKSIREDGNLLATLIAAMALIGGAVVHVEGKVKAI